MKIQRVFPPLFIACFGLVVALILDTGDPVNAQSNQWNPPVQLYSTDNRVGDPLLLSDAAGRLHVFWNEVEMSGGQSSGNPTIYYMMKDDDNWFGPVDILTGDRGVLDDLRGSIDSSGRSYLVGGGVNKTLSYSHAYDPFPLGALTWQPLRVITGFQVGGDILVGMDGVLHTVYGDIEGRIHYLQLNDSGVIEKEEVIAWLPGSQLLMRPPRMIEGANGVLHVLLPAVTPPANDLGSYYIRSEDGGETWTDLSTITLLDRLSYAIAEDNDGLLHILFIGRAGVGGRYERVSEDGGITWSEPVTISTPEDGSGLSGGDLSVDSAGSLHAVFGLDGTEDHIVVHSMWDGIRWSPWQDISRGVPGHMERMEIEVTYGNRLHAVWESDRNSIWYAEGRSSALEVAPDVLIPISRSTPVSEALDASPTQAPVSLPVTPATLSENALQAPSSNFSGATSILAAAGAAIAIIVVVVLWQFFSRGR
jgi:hypothetical protein